MENNNKKRYQSLDGIRAISILLVIYDHAFRPELINLGGLGVRIFFIISSFLIVGILLEEVNRGRFSLKNFYYKRLMRILPAYYFYLLVIFLFLKSLSVFKWEQFWRAPLFLVNYQPRSDWQFPYWFVGHSWSLAVEEQFYILIAILFFFVARKIINKSKLLFIFFTIILIAPLLRVSYMYFNFFPDILRDTVNRSFETVADSLAVGGILAILGNTIMANKWFLYVKKTAFVFLGLIIILMILNSSIVSEIYGLKPRYFYNLVGQTIINFSVGILILICLSASKKSMLYILLNNKIIMTVGLWSYSIYLWQQVWLYNWDIPLYFKLIGILFFSILSYYCIELPFLKIRDNYLMRKRAK